MESQDGQVTHGTIVASERNERDPERTTAQTPTLNWSQAIIQKMLRNYEFAMHNRIIHENHLALDSPLTRHRVQLPLPQRGVDGPRCLLVF